MSFGFEATNQAGQVLVSSSTRNLHFIGKATLTTTINSFNGYGGLRHWAFRINTTHAPMPFFTVPTMDYYGIAAIRQISVGLWEIEVIRSGVSATIPEVFVFVDPRGAPNSADNYGMQVLHDDGTPSFDSRFHPLSVSGGALVAPPANPIIHGPGSLSARSCNSDASSTLAPSESTNYIVDWGAGAPIVFFPTLAQAQREFTYTETTSSCLGIDAYGVCWGYGEGTKYQSTYWAFYRAGVRLISNTLSCGWITVKYACNWRQEEKGTLIGIGISGGTDTGGVWPYSNQTINLAATAVISSQASLYV